MLGPALVVLPLALAEPAAPEDAGVHRGQGWYVAGPAVPEPPIALALVIIAAGGMRVRERRLRRAGQARP